MSIEVKQVPTPKGEVSLVRITNSSGAWVELTSIGAGVMAVAVPDRSGHLDDVAIGYENIEDYFGDGPGSGKIPGRYANRIGLGQFTLDGVTYQIPVNNGPNSCHTGEGGFHNRNWTLVSAQGDTAQFRYVSADGECGFPGNLTVTATYRWTDDNSLELTLHAVTDKATVLNLTNHTYWNLSGHDSGSVLNHELKLNSSHFLVTDRYLLPTGELAPVAGTPMDFTTSKAIGRDINQEFTPLKYGKGYDHCWAADGADGSIREMAVLHDPVSGRTLRVSSDQPAAQVYTGNWLTGSPRGKGGIEYRDYDAVAIECQNYPDAPNKPTFPNAVLRPGEEYLRHIVYSFSAE